MKRGDLVGLAPYRLPLQLYHKNQIREIGIIIRPAKRGYDWFYAVQGWWVMWSDGDRTVESEKDIMALA